MKVISLFMFLAACASHHEKGLDSIEGGMLSKYNDYHQCYVESDTYMRKENMNVVYTFVILPDGSTSEQKIKEQIPKDPNFSTCFLMVMKPLKFIMPVKESGTVATKPLDRKDLPAGSIVVTQPFNFKAKLN